MKILYCNVGRRFDSCPALNFPSNASSGPVSLTIQAVDQNKDQTQAPLNLTIDTSPVSTGTIYSYCVPDPNNANCSTGSGYDGVGNVMNFIDSVIGTWSYSYDTLNRLALGNATTGDFDGQYATASATASISKRQQARGSRTRQAAPAQPLPVPL